MSVNLTTRSLEPLASVSVQPDTPVPGTTESPTKSNKTSLFDIFKEENALGPNNELIPSPEFPPCTQTQTNALVELIDETFDLKDKDDGTVILRNFSARRALNLLFKSQIFIQSKIYEKTVLLGGAVTPVLESDMDWNAECVKACLSKKRHAEVDDLLAPSAKRRLPDLDIHIICKANTFEARNNSLDQVLQILADEVLVENSEYLQNQAKKYSQINIKADTDKNIKQLHNEAKTYMENKDGDIGKILLATFAKSLIKSKCLDKYSEKFPIITIGKIELVLNEGPNYLLTPDRLGFVFDRTIKANSQNQIQLYPENHKSKESVIHRAMKIASIDQEATEHTFLKTCVYEMLKYTVLGTKKLDDAHKAFEKFIISSHSLTKNGKKLIERFVKNHFIPNPTEGLQTIAFMLKALNSKPEVISLIMEQLKFLAIEQEMPSLEVLRKLIVKHPQKITIILNCFNLFETPYKFLKDTPEQSFKLICNTESNELTNELLQEFFNANIPVAYDSLECLHSQLPHQKYRKHALNLILHSENTKITLELLAHVPLILPELDKTGLQLLNERLKGYSTSIQALMEHPDYSNEKNRNMLWLVILAQKSEFASLVFSLWRMYKIEMSETSLIIADALFEAGSHYAFSIYQKVFPQLGKAVPIEYQIKVKDHLLKLISSGSPLLKKDLAFVWEDVLITLFDLAIDRNAIEAVNEILDTLRSDVDYLKLLGKSKQDFWHYLSIEESISIVISLTQQGTFDKVSEGIDSILRKPPTPEQLRQLLPCFKKFDSYFAKNKNETAQAALMTSLFRILNKVNDSTCLQNLLDTCLKLHQNSKMIIFLQPLNLGIELFVGLNQDNLLPSDVIATLTRLANDRIRLLEPFKQQVSKLLSEVISKSNKDDANLIKLFKILKEKNISLTETKEIAEVNWRIELAKADIKIDTDSKIVSLFDQSKAPNNKVEYHKHINNFFEHLLEDNKLNKIPLFLTSLKSSIPNFDYSRIEKIVLEKYNKLYAELNKSRSRILKHCIEYLCSGVENGLLSNEKAKELFSKLELKPSEILDQWDLLFNCIQHCPVLRPVLLEIVILSVPKRKLEQFNDYFSREILENSFPELSPQQVRTCIIAFLKRLGEHKSSLLFELIYQKSNIKKCLLPTDNNILVQWICNLCDFVNCAKLIPKEFNSFFEFFEETESDCKPDNPELVHKLKWSVIHFLSNANTNPEDLLYTWRFLELDLEMEYEEHHVKYFRCIDKLFDSDQALIEAKDVDASDEDALIRVSDFFIKAYTKTSQELSSFKSTRDLTPFRWINYLHSVGTDVSCENAFKWLPALTKSKKELTHQQTFVIKELFCGRFKTMNFETSSSKIIKYLKYLSILESDYNLDEAWENLLTLVNNKFIDNPTSENADLFIKVMQSSIKCTHRVEVDIKRVEHTQRTKNFHVSAFIEINDNDLGTIFTFVQNKDFPRFISLWNYCVTKCISKVHEEIPIVYQSSTPIKGLQNEGIVIAESLEKINPAYKQQYLNLLKSTVDLIDVLLNQHHEELSLREKQFLLDLAHGCTLILIKQGIHIEIFDAVYTFEIYFNLVTRSDEINFKIHMEKHARALFEDFCFRVKNLHRMDLFNLCFIQFNYPKKFEEYAIKNNEPISSQTVKKAMDKLLDQELIPKVSVQANAYQIVAMSGAIEKGYLHDLEQYVNFLQTSTKILLKLESEASAEDIAYLKTMGVFRLTPENRKSISRVIKKEKDLKKAQAEIDMALFNTLLELMESKHLGSWRDIDFLGSFQSDFGDFTAGYEKEMERLLESFGKGVGTCKTWLEVKALLDKVHPFVMTFEVALSPEGTTRRKAFTEKWISTYKDQPDTNSKLLFATLTKLSQKHEMIF